MNGMGRFRHQRVRVGSVVLGAAIALVAPAAGVAASGPASAAMATSPSLVSVKSGQDPGAIAASVGAVPTMLYHSAIDGFAADLTSSQISKLSKSVNVTGVEPDQTVSVDAQQISNYARRVGATLSPTAHIDNVDERVNADVAILDTGIDPAHPDLNVVGGVDCQHGSGYADTNGHGTMVGGFAAALDNKFGTVGIAPGARLWSVRVLNKNGIGSWSQVLCGIDWVTAHAGTIEVANMSLGGKGLDTGSCGSKGKQKSMTHQAICASVAAGVTYVVAAGNDANDAAGHIPAAFDEVITTSAFTDIDGIPGGLGPANICLANEYDDRFATFSNFGPDVDLMAPGVCMTSTYPNSLSPTPDAAIGSYAYGSGTSFASPIVAGAAALYRSTHPLASPVMVRQALLDAAQAGTVTGDPDAFPEPVVNVSTF